MRAAITSLLLALASVAVTLSVGEAACRLVGYRGLERYRPDRELGWVLEPDQRTVTRAGHLPVRINADGFRDDPLQRPKPPRTIRIFALGGSTTFGWGVQDRETYHQVLEQMLNDSAEAVGFRVRFEIVNAGVIGYNLWQAGHSMRRIVRDYQPDGFLVAYTFNDAWNQVGNLDSKQIEGLLAGVRRKNLLRRSALFNWLIDLRARRVSERAGAGLVDELATIQTGDTASSRAELAAYRATLDSMIDLARSARLALAFTVLAARGQERPWSRQTEMRDAAAAAGVPALDLAPVFGAADPDSVYLSHDAVHPSPSGHAEIARLTYTNLCAAAIAAPPDDPIIIYRSACRAAPRSPSDK